MRAGPVQSNLRRLSAARLIACAALIACPAACRHTSKLIDLPLPPIPPLEDAAVELDPPPDGAKLCTSAADCDDGVSCTEDKCQPGHYCTNALVSSLCSDGVFCNGEEVCDPVAGCMPSGAPNCDDQNLCTIDACDERLKACRHDPRDFDGDGEADWHCAGGTDCDDLDPARGSRALELCGDGVDNDCDNLIDEQDCGRAEHDDCSQALDVSAGGSYEITLAGARADYALSCGDSAMPDVAFSFELSEAKDLTLTASGRLGRGGDETATLGLLTDCADIGSERKCSEGFPAQIRTRALPAGRYYAVVGSAMSSSVVLAAQFDPPTDPPTNTTCEHALDISAGGRFEGSMVDAGDDEQLACGPDGSVEDLIYSFSLADTHDVELAATSLDGGRMSFAVRSTCHDPSTTLRCVSDAPARARLYQLPPGTYYVVLEGQASRLVDFALDVAVLDPTDPPAGDGCDNPLDLPLGMQLIDTLANRQDFVDVMCRCDPGQGTKKCDSFLPDVVYRVSVEKPTDLEISVDAGSASMIYALRSSCDMQPTQLACGTGTLIDGRARNLTPGDYYLILESSAPATMPASYKVQVDLLPRTQPVQVSDNENCATAFDVPADGGSFTGDTLNALDDYQAASCGGGTQSGDVVFRVVLKRQSRVTAMLSAPFDPVLYHFTDTGAGAASCSSKNETACNDDGPQGSTDSQLVETLDPGTYYYIVDGVGSGNAGQYLFDVSIVPQ